jgi:hypothetical protein
LLVKCHGGCETESVLLALGLGFRDLFDDASGAGVVAESNKRLAERSAPSVEIEVLGPTTSAQAFRLKQSRRITRAEVLEEIGADRIRWHGREWLQLRALGGSAKCWGIDANGRPRLDDRGRMERRNLGPHSVLLSPDLRQPGASLAPRGWDFEGESDWLAWISVGGCSAVTSTGGADSIRGHDAHRDEILALRPAEIVVVRDIDDPGRAGAEKVAQWWLAQGIPVRVLELPAELGDGGDVRDYVLGRPARNGEPAREPLGGLADLDALADSTTLRRPGGSDKSDISDQSRSAGSKDVAFVASVAALDPEWPAPPDESAFHGLAGDFVRLVELQTESDPVALLVGFLVMFGSAAGRHRYVAVEADRHYPNLFAVLVGETSHGRKGTSHGRAQAPFRAADPTWAEQRNVGGLSSGEGMIWGVRDRITRREPVKQSGRVVDYQEVEVDPGIADKRLLVFEPEFASTLKVMGREGNTLSAVLRQAWDRGDLATLTKNSPAKATGGHVSILGHIGRDELRASIDRTDLGNGFANRFAWPAVRRSKCLPDGGKPVDLAPIVRRLGEALAFAKRPGEVSKDAAAAKRWRDVYPTLSEGHPGLFGAVTSRAEAQVTRLALVYSLLDRSESIQLVHLEAALALWRYCADSARYIFGDALGDPVADGILSALRARGDEGLSRTEIRDVFGRHRKADEVERALSILRRLGRARCVAEVTGGRPAERWHATAKDRLPFRPPPTMTGFVRLHVASAEGSLDPAAGTALPQPFTPPDSDVPERETPSEYEGPL